MPKDKANREAAVIYYNPFTGKSIGYRKADNNDKDLNVFKIAAIKPYRLCAPLYYRLKHVSVSYTRLTLLYFAAPASSEPAQPIFRLHHLCIYDRNFRKNTLNSNANAVSKSSTECCAGFYVLFHT